MNHEYHIHNALMTAGSLGPDNERDPAGGRTPLLDDDAVANIHVTSDRDEEMGDFADIESDRGGGLVKRTGRMAGTATFTSAVAVEDQNRDDDSDIPDCEPVPLDEQDQDESRPAE